MKIVNVVMSMALGVSLLTGCVSYDNYYKLAPDYLKHRQYETKRFDTTDEKLLLVSATQVLQDLGFNLTESELPLGIITASKDRDATNGGQIAGAVVLALLTGAVMPTDTVQKIHVTVVTTKNNAADGFNVRAKFARVVFNNAGGARIEPIQEPEIYKQFFDKMSQSLFLTANDI